MCEWDGDWQDLLANGLTGWRGDTKYWSVSNGQLIGKSPGNLSRGQFLILEEPQDDFELQCQFQLVGGEGNSGIQIRSTDWGSQGVKGHQVDLAYGDFSLLGCLVGERIGNSRIEMTTDAQKSRLRQSVDQTGWNDLFIKADKRFITIRVNTETTVITLVPGIPPSGVIALQLHGGAPTEVRFRNMRLRAIGDPSVTVSSTSLNAKSFSGDFHQTIWRATDSQGDAYTLTFRLGGQLTYDAGRVVRHNGTWTASGDTVQISINDGVASLTGTVKNDRLEGTGRSEVGGSWDWSAALQ